MTAPVNVAAPPAAPAGQVVTPRPLRPVRLIRLDRPGRLAGVGLVQVVGVQVGLTLLLVGIGIVTQEPGAGRWVWLSVGVLAALVAAANLVRWDGRWPSEWALIRFRWWMRRRRLTASTTPAAATVSAPTVSAPALSGPSVSASSVSAAAVSTGSIALGGSTGVPADLAVVLPGLKVSGFVDRAARRHGLLFDGIEWTAVLAVAPPDQVVEFDGAPTRVPMRVLAASLEDRGIRLRTIQVLSVTAPLRAGVDLASGTAGVARRRSYIALTLDPTLAGPAARARGGGPEGSRRAVTVAASRVAARLAEVGVNVSLLDVDQTWLSVRTCLATLPTPGRGPDRQVTPVAASPSSRPTGPEVPEERWRGWYSEGVLHVGYRVTRWSSSGEPFDVLDALALVPGVAVVTSLSVAPSRLGGHSVSAVIRVAGRPWGLAAHDREIRRLAGSLGARVERLDGEHLPALAATLPLGGPR
jgi:type VII secretion protein EccE